MRLWHEKRAERRALRDIVAPKVRQLRQQSRRRLLVCIALLILLNLVLGAVLAQTKTVDLTEQKIMSTGEVTRSLLTNLETDVEIIVLDDPVNFASYNQFMLPLLEEYERYGNGKVSVFYKHPTDYPDLVYELDPNERYNLQPGQIVVSAPQTDRIRPLGQTDILQTTLDQTTGKLVQTGYNAEAALSGAIQFVTAETVPTVYFSQGHGEASLNESYTAVKQLLMNNRFDIKELSAPGNPIPEDAEAVFILAPEQDLLPAEAEIYSAYIRQGGNLLVAVDYNETVYDNLNKVLEVFDLAVTNQRVAEENKQLIFNDDPFSILAQAPASRLSPKEFANSTLMLNARAITDSGQPAEWIGSEAVVTTDEQGVLLPKGEWEQKSAPTKQSLAMVSEHTGYITPDNMTASRAVVFGSAEAFSDGVLQILGQSGYNYNLLFNSAVWLTEQGNTGGRLLIAEKPLMDYRLTSLNNTAYTVVTLFVIVVTPLVFFIIAGMIQRRRKYL